MKTLLILFATLLRSKYFLALVAGATWIFMFPTFYESLPKRIDITSDHSLEQSVWITEVPFDEQTHQYALFKPTVKNKYTKNVHYFMKKIGCRGGQYLIANDDRSFYCDNKFIGKAKESDVDGNKVDYFHYSGVIPKEQFFVIGTHPRSYDSRYYGFISKNQILRGASPLW